MYLFQYTELVILVVICYSNEVHNKSKKQAFEDVLKNITLANKILQDLIKNYERIDKIYQSEELLQSNSSSIESDQTFKGLLTTKPNFKQRDITINKYVSSTHKGTAIIYESISNEKVSDDSTEETKEVDTYTEPNKSDSYYIEVKKEGTKDLSAKFTNKKVFNNNFYNKNYKIVNITNPSHKKAKPNEITDNIESEEVEQIIIEIPNKVRGVIFTNLSEKFIKSESTDKSIKNMWGKKTRFNIQHTANNKHKTNVSRVPLNRRNNTRLTKRIVRTEIFSPDKIWQEIVSKPVRLINQSSEVFRKSNKVKSENTGKITVYLLTNNKKENQNLKTEQIINQSQDVPESVLQNKILRSEYGDTCLQMPIIKCEKAMKIVSKNICKRRFKCKSDFKSDFTQHVRDGCNKEFAYTEVVTDNVTEKENIEKYSPPEFRELKEKRFNNGRGKKEKSIKVLSEYKLQPLKDFISLRNDTPPGAFLRKKRDKYEKKCQKESTKKCNNACSYAINETCSVHVCEKKKRKAIKVECKNQCKKAFEKIKKQIKSSSKSNSDSDSDSVSDS